MPVSRPNNFLSLPRSSSRYWLDKNEFLFKPIQELIMSTIHDIDPFVYSTYPDLAPAYDVLSQYTSVLPQNLFFTNGSDGGIKLVFDHLCQPNDLIFITEPTFLMYDVYCSHRPYRVSRFPYHFDKSSNSFELDVSKILSSITQFNPKLVCIPFPDSPTGSCPSIDFITQILAVLSPSSFLLVDEAYYGFCDISCVDLLNNHPNLIIVRSLDKSLGLAGFRLGYIMAHQSLISIFNTFRPMYEIGSVQAKMAQLLLSKSSLISKILSEFMLTKQNFERHLFDKGIHTISTRTNFSILSSYKPTSQVLDAFIVKYYDNGLMSGMTRVTVSDLPIMNKLLSLL